MIKQTIKDSDLKEYLEALPKDTMIHFTMAEGRVRGAIFSGTSFVNQMRAQHNTGILETYILGQASLCGALLIPALMKGREHLSWRYDVEDSPAKGFNVEADSTGWVRSYLLTDHIPIEKPLESWDLTPFLGGDGFMTIQTVHPGDKYPATSSVNTAGNIADDLVFYFDRSVQLSTAINTSIFMDTEGRVKGAGGIFIQVMPETGGHFNGKEKLGSQINTSADTAKDEALLEDLEKAFKAAPSLGKWFSQGKTAQQFIEEVFADFNVIAAVERDIVYDCPCCKEDFIRHIKTLPKSDLDDIISKNEPIEVVCRNCNSAYQILPEELK